MPDKNNLVYSTAKGAPQAASKAGQCKARLEKNGRGGKTVTVIFALPFAEAEARVHMRNLQSQLGAGGSYKDGNIELRGDVRGRVQEYFAKLDIKVILAGG